MNKIYLMIGIAMAFIMVLPMIMAPVGATKPSAPTAAGGDMSSAGRPGPNTLVEDTLNGGGPVSLDPAAMYDTASAELLMNVYDPLIFFNGEQIGNVPNSGVSNEYVPMLATQVTVQPPITTGPTQSPLWTNFTVDFKIRTGVPFTTWCGTGSAGGFVNYSWPQFYVTPQDVAYSFDRNLVHSYAMEGSYWLITDALLLQDGAPSVANLTSLQFKLYLEGAVQYNSTDCWFNIPNVNFATGYQSFAAVNMFNPPLSFLNGTNFNQNFWTLTGALPLDYPLNTFFQVWAQQWESIVSYDWTVQWLKPWLYANVGPDNPSGSPPTGNEIEWTFDDWDNWSMYYNPALPIYDEVNGGIACGTGAYILQSMDSTTGGAFVLTRNLAYWAGWPASWPNVPYPPQPTGDNSPQGWVDTFEVLQIATATGITNLASGLSDFSYAPLSRDGPLFTGVPYPTSDPRYINDATIAGVQCNYPIPGVATESWFMNQNITRTLTNPYGIINPAGVWINSGPNAGIPADFFANLNIRKMFAYCINESFYIQTQFLGRGYQPITCAPDGFPYINLSQPVYSIDLTQATNYMNAANTQLGGNLTGIGFTLNLMYNPSNIQRQNMMQNLQAMINSLNGNFHATATACVSWGQEQVDMTAGLVPDFMIGWLADYSGLQDFMVPYMFSGSTYALFTAYHNPTVDALLAQTAYANNPALLTALYGQLEAIYYNDVPSVTIMSGIGTGFHRDWVQGRYYNPLYPGIYAYNLWKYNGIPGDVNRNGAVNMADVIDLLKAFGSYYGQFGAGGGFWPIMQARWNFYCDVIGTPRLEWTDRTINMGDIVTALSHFGQVDTPSGTIPSPNPYLAPSGNGAWNYTLGWYGITVPAP